MVLFRYLARRFLAFVVVISVLFAFLFNFIEFFEKIVQVKDVSTGAIVHFLSLNFVPSLFELLPTSVWLSTLFLFKDLSQRHELEILQLVTYLPRRFFVFLLSMGLLLSLAAMIINETCVIKLSLRADRFKQEKLRQSATQRLVSKWLELDNNVFGYFSVLDLEQFKGKDLLVIALKPTFELDKIIMAPQFEIDPTNNSIQIPVGQIIQIEQHTERSVHNFSLASPSFFSQLRTNFELPTLLNFIKKIVLYKDILPQGVYRDLLYDFFMRLTYYFQLLLYPLLTFCLFMLSTLVLNRWILALMPYPYFMLSKVVIHGLIQKGVHPIIAIFPYFLIGIFIALCWFYRCK